MKFDSKLTFESKTMGVSLFLMSLGELVFFWLVKRIFVDTSVLLRFYVAFVLPILEYCSPVWGSAAECHLQHLERQVCSVARLCPDQSFLSLLLRRHVAGLCMMYKIKIRTRITVCSASLLLPECDIPRCGRSSSMLIDLFHIPFLLIIFTIIVN